jgi:hypothetical protein
VKLRVRSRKVGVRGGRVVEVGKWVREVDTKGALGKSSVAVNRGLAPEIAPGALGKNLLPNNFPY